MLEDQAWEESWDDSWERTRSFIMDGRDGRMDEKQSYDAMMKRGLDDTQADIRSELRESKVL